MDSLHEPSDVTTPTVSSAGLMDICGNSPDSFNFPISVSQSISAAWAGVAPEGPKRRAARKTAITAAALDFTGISQKPSEWGELYLHFSVIRTGFSMLFPR